MKHFYRFLILLLVVCLFSFFELSAEKETINTIYNVSGIMFSVGLGLIVSLNYSDIKNKNYLISIRKNIRDIRNIFISYFLIETMLFMFTGKELGFVFLSHIKYDVFFAFFAIYTIIYFTVNFLQIQKLNDDISDKKNEEENKNRSL